MFLTNMRTLFFISKQADIPGGLPMILGGMLTQKCTHHFND